MVQHFSLNDAVLLGSLFYSCADLQQEWDTFSSCSKPLHWWLLVSYTSAIAFRAAHMLGTRAASGGSDENGAVESGRNAKEFLLDLRHKGYVARMLVLLTWTLALPFFAFWTLLGTNWLWIVSRDTPQCLPSPTHLWFSAFWLFLCYVWIIVHVGLGIVALVLERRVRRAETSLREIEDDEVRERWGQVSQISDYHALAGPTAPTTSGGLRPSEIKALPCGVVPDSEEWLSVGQRECSICLGEIEPGSAVRCLPGCGHTFHRSCIDLWLLRQADCPLCKRNVIPTADKGVWV